MTRAVRPGEELDVVAVDRWLKTQVPGLEGTPEVTQYTGGASNWTYRLRYPGSAPRTPGTAGTPRTPGTAGTPRSPGTAGTPRSPGTGRDLVLRRPPAGTKAKSAHDMAREHDLQLALKPSFSVVPTMVALCRDLDVIGCDFYVMEHIDGLIPRKELPAEMHTLGEAGTRALCENVVDKLVELHAVPLSPELERFHKGAGYVRRQVEGWCERYNKAKTWNVGGFTTVQRWLKERIPDDVGACVIHNDWRFDNCIFDRTDMTRVIGVLDWELATVGDPLMDLGSALAYWVHADDSFVLKKTRRQPTHLPGMLRREQVVARYLDKSGRSLPTGSFLFYEVFGLFRLAGIAQQIYYRYHHGQTRNPAFRNFWLLINFVEWRCRGLIRAGR